MGLSPTFQAIYHEEMTRSRAPGHPSPTSFIVGPTLIVHGTESQRRQHLGPLLCGDVLWCQGFSEPGAGSDLASLRTTARLEGDEFVVTGQKVWTTRADHADWMFALVRTGGAGPTGISYLLIDMRSPGIEVRPLRDLTGAAHFSEVFLDEVRVPRENLVGELDGGWAIARTSLGHERATAFAAQQYRYRRILSELFRLAADLGRSHEPLVRQDLARLESSLRILSIQSQRTLADIVRSGAPGPAASVSRLLSSRFEQLLHEVAVDVLGSYALLAPSAPESIEGGRWVYGFLRTRASTIGAGTSEIQRQTIGERVLGLPREEELV